MEHNISPLGDSAVMVQFGENIELDIHYKVRAFVQALEEQALPGIVEFIPAYTSVAVFYDPLYYAKPYKKSEANDLMPYQRLCRDIEQILSGISVSREISPRIIDIPVCYGGDFGPDLEYVAEHNNLSKEEVIKIHSGGDYLVYMIGFAPGFPYIGGMPTEIATPRRSSPRLAIPKGSVGIAGKQTGVYPIETPGGWQLIGRTPLELFQSNTSNPSLLRAGDKIRFVPICEEEYKSLKEGRK